MKNTDVVIVGAGTVGCVLDNKLSSELNLKCLIIEKRNHIAGNCYDEYNKKGLLYHKYGPHYLRFKNRKTLNYLSKFSKWIPGEYIVKSYVKKFYFRIKNFPENNSLYKNEVFIDYLKTINLIYFLVLISLDNEASFRAIFVLLPQSSVLFILASEEKPLKNFKP